jgi:hypothetical protein
MCLLFTGATSGFPLLDLLTAKPLNNEQDDIQTVDRNPDIIIGLHSPLEPTLTASSTTPKSTGSDDSAVAQPQSTSTAQEDEEHTGTKSGAREPSRKNGKKKEERFFPDRAPRPSQMLNPEATWRVITNVIPSDLMDTLVRCYVSLPALIAISSLFRLFWFDVSFRQVTFCGHFYMFPVFFG